MYGKRHSRAGSTAGENPLPWDDDARPAIGLSRQEEENGMSYAFVGRRWWVLVSVAVVVAFCAGSPITDGLAADAPPLDRPPAGDEVSYRPEDGEQVATNPPAFVWLPVRAAGAAGW
jgi:hypothetical protein